MNPSMQDRNTQELKPTAQIPLQNRFENLAQVQNIDKSTSKTENKISKSPPIFVAGIANVILQLY